MFVGIYVQCFCSPLFSLLCDTAQSRASKQALIQLAASQSPVWVWLVATNRSRSLTHLSHCSLNDTNYSPSGCVLGSDKPKISLSNYQDFLLGSELMSGVGPWFGLWSGKGVKLSVAVGAVIWWWNQRGMCISCLVFGGRIQSSVCDRR